MNIKTQINLWKLLILLELINYQVVTVICNDFIVFKFMRDILLILIVFNFFIRRKSLVWEPITFSILMIIVFLLWATLNTSGFSAIFVFIRKYLSPILLLFTIINEKNINEQQHIGILRYLLNLTAILSAWGIFQAFVLGPQFLMKLGYPTKYSYAYQTVTLKDSFYFGNLGIQRVVGTLSNANVFALILGCVILLVILNYRKILLNCFEWIKLFVVILGYLLTVSRANFLAIIIVALVIMWKNIPFKEYLLMMVLCGSIAFIGLYLYQDEMGITHKLVNWVVSSLTFKESSAAGRSGIWEVGFQAVLENPLGIGFGKVGSWAVTNGAQEVYSCESSYLAMGLDMGWLGVIAYVSLWILIVRQAYLYRQQSREGAKTVIAIIAYSSIAFVFSNHIYDKEAVTINYFISGLPRWLSR